MKIEKQFFCKTCNRMRPWFYLHHKSTGKNDECIICYWDTKPSHLDTQVERRVLFSK